MRIYQLIKHSKKQSFNRKKRIPHLHGFPKRHHWLTNVSKCRIFHSHFSRQAFKDRKLPTFPPEEGSVGCGKNPGEVRGLGGVNRKTLFPLFARQIRICDPLLFPPLFRPKVCMCVFFRVRFAKSISW